MHCVAYRGDVSVGCDINTMETLHANKTAIYLLYNKKSLQKTASH